MLEKIKYKLKRRVYAIILNSKGEQLDRIKLNNTKNSFNYKNGTYFYDKAKYNYLDLPFKNMTRTCFLYIIGNAEPIAFYNKGFHLSPEKKPYIAEDFYSLLQADQLRKLNAVGSGLFNIEPKKLIIGAVVVIAIFYALSNGII